MKAASNKGKEGDDIVIFVISHNLGALCHEQEPLRR